MENTQQAQQPEIQTEFDIPACNEGEFLAKLAKLNKAAAKLGVPPIKVEKTGEHKVAILNEEGRTTGAYRMVYEYTVEGLAPKMSGWTFCAVVEPTPAGNSVRCVPGMDVATTYQTATLSCQHCNKIRKRSEYFVVRHDDGTEKTVGRNCIKDFLGHTNPEQIARMMELIASIKAGEDEEGWGFGGGKQPIFFAIHDLAQWTLAVIGRYGFVPRSAMKPNTTSSEVSYLLTYPRWSSKQEQREWQEARDRFESFKKPQEASKALEWIYDLENKAVRSNFENNLLIAVKLEKVGYQELGLFCAGIHNAMKAIGAAIAAREERKNKSNEHVGTIKKREVFELTVTKLRDINTDFGTSVLFIMEDEKGNAFKWFASKDTGMEVGKRYKIKGTVKAHDEYQGRKQTSLTRCKNEGEIVQTVEASA